MQEIASARVKNFKISRGGGGMSPDPPRKEGLPKQHLPVMLNYPPVPKFIETPDYDDVDDGHGDDDDDYH